jgi:hypothetical protein
MTVVIWRDKRNHQEKETRKEMRRKYMYIGVGEISNQLPLTFLYKECRGLWRCKLISQLMIFELREIGEN